MDNRMIIDRFIAGYVSGISLVFVGHPFDVCLLLVIYKYNMSLMLIQ